MADRLYRSPTDRVIAGVAGGMATWLGIDPSLVRIAWVLLGIFSGGIFVLIYIVMMIVVPLPPPGWVPRSRAGGVPPGGWPAAGSPPAGSPPAGGGPPPPEGGWASVPPPATGPSMPDVDAGRLGIVGGAVLVVLGVWFLIDQYVDIDWDLLWPVVIVVIGIGVIAAALQRGRSSS